MSVEHSLLALDPLRVTVITQAVTTTTQAVVAELRRSAMQVELQTTEVLGSAPQSPVYVVSVDPATGPPLADQLVAWASDTALRPGLIALIENGSVRDAESLLAAGFDDIAVTPVSPREVAARVRAVHRRVHWKSVPNGRLRFGELTLDLYGRALWFRGRTISLTSIELAVLRELIKARGRPLSRIELLDRAWGEQDLEVSERAVDNVVLRLRRKLLQPDVPQPDVPQPNVPQPNVPQPNVPQPNVIETVRSVGFRLASG